MKALYEEAGLKVILSKKESVESYYLRRKGIRNIYYGLPTPPDALLNINNFLKSLSERIKSPIFFLKSTINYIRMIIGWSVSFSLDVITVGKK